VAVGRFAGLNAGASPANTSARNTLIGDQAGRLANDGTNANRIDDSVLIGFDTRVGATGQTNQIVIGYNGRGNGSNTTTLGNSSTTGTFIPGGNLTLSNGNLILGTPGNGIDFSATADGSGTMTSELLDDYEEGTWSPSYGPAAAFTTMTMDIQSATYTKIGRLVTVTAFIQTDNVVISGTPGTELQITGLPFSVASLARSAVAIGQAELFAGDYPAFGYAAGGVTFIRLQYRDASDGTSVNMDPNDLTTGASANQNVLVFTCSYITS
jgi:hypothetical protein